MTPTYDVAENGNENRVLFWLRLDSWQLSEAALLFAEIDPDSLDKLENGSYNFCKLTSLSGISYDAFDTERSLEDDTVIFLLLDRFESQYKVMQRWLYNPEIEQDTPNNWIKRALAKKITIPWLDFAIEQDFYVPVKHNKENLETEKPLSTRTENNYLRLILSLANGIKDFNPKKPYEAAQLIIDETGIDISKQTISDYIAKAYELESQKRD